MKFFFFFVFVQTWDLSLRNATIKSSIKRKYSQCGERRSFVSKKYFVSSLIFGKQNENIVKDFMKQIFRIIYYF